MDEVIEPGVAMATPLAALAQRRADRVRHTGRRTLRAHLEGTWRILAGWGQPAALCHAGLFHSCYATQAFEHPLFDVSERGTVRDLIGDEAEALAFLYCRLDRAELLTHVADLERIPDGGLPASDHRTGERWILPPRAAAALLTLEMANIADQAAGPGDGPGSWLSDVASLGRLVRPYAAPPPPVFDGCTATLRPEDEDAARWLYHDGTAALGADPGAAEQRLSAACRQNPWVGEPLFLLATLATGAGRRAEAQERCAAALRRFQEWGTAWDKRRPLSWWVRQAGEIEALGIAPA